ncbi:UNVERIFIED_CONTAM: hypothetical protein HDU68_000114 [Siphonaria sp. JEL0065]|nr:hypothetical protein HDU68_000114 [Siphonaria sp. JEL0065]
MSIYVLPQELLRQILIHLPVDWDLADVAFASKALASLVFYDFSFANEHIKHQNNVPDWNDSDSDWSHDHEGCLAILEEIEYESDWVKIPLNYQAVLFGETLGASYEYIEYYDNQDSLLEDQLFQREFKRLTALFGAYPSKKAHKLFQVLLSSHLTYDFGCQNNRPLRFAAYRGYFDVVEGLLLRANEAVDPSAGDCYVFRSAVSSNRAELVELLLKDARVDPSACQNEAFSKAISNDNSVILALLLADPHVNPSTNTYNDTIQLASRNGYTQVLCLLLADSRMLSVRTMVTSTALNNSLLLTIEKRHLQTFTLLFSDPSMIPFPETYINGINKASHTGQTEILRHLLSDPRMPPSTLATTLPTALLLATEKAHLEAFLLLLSNPHFSPPPKDFYFIIKAAENNHPQILQHLLSDPRFDPREWNNRAICFASERGHVQIVDMLLKVGRADLSAHDNYSIRAAGLLGHVDVLERLLLESGGKVDPLAGGGAGRVEVDGV